VNGRVVVSLISEEQEFQRLQAEEALATAARLGLEAGVLFAGNDAARQARELARLAQRPEDERPAAIVVETVTGEGLEQVARAAVASGIGWVILNRQVPYLEALRRQQPGLAICMVSTDQEEVGRIQARQFRALLPRGGALLYVQGPADTSVARDRLRGVEAGTRGAAIRLEVVNGDWSEHSGEQAVASWLRLAASACPRPDLVGCQNDAMAMGARRALAALRPEWGDVPLTGCDGLPAGGRRLVDEGVLAATVATPSNTGPALERIASWLRSGIVPPREVLIEPHSHPAESSIRP
jgi:ABC-type sugar transport system substrate-binding protein